MKPDLKKVCAIHDLSGYGRCSLSVIIPVLAAMGVQPCAVPTAVLSSHTGGYSGFTFRDLSEDMNAYVSHWIKEGFEFDAVYTGFLACCSQIATVSDIIDRLRRKGSVILVDPVMGDDGSLYQTYNPQMVEGMKRLVSKATVITPNVTEAAMLLNREYSHSLSSDEIRGMLEALCRMGPSKCVITGIRHKSQIISAYFDSEDGCTGFYEHKRVDKSYPGTGDIFASVLLGSMLSGSALADACAKASDFVKSLIDYSAGFDYPEREGVLLEKKLFELR